jgi:hypothetical protein
VPVPEPVDRVVVEQPALRQRGGADLPLRPLAEIAAEPLLDRRDEPLLRPLDDVAWQQAGDRLLEQHLAAFPGRAQPRPQGHGEFDHVLIEEGHSSLDRVGHGHLVHAHQQQLGEAVLQLQVRHALQQVGALGLGPEAADDLVRVRVRAPVGQHPLLQRALVGDRAAPEGPAARGRLLERLGVRDTATGVEGEARRGAG